MADDSGFIYHPIGDDSIRNDHEDCLACSCFSFQLPTHWTAEWTDGDGQRWRQRLGIKAPGSDVPDNGPLIAVWVE